MPFYLFGNRKQAKENPVQDLGNQLEDGISQEEWREYCEGSVRSIEQKGTPVPLDEQGFSQ